MLEIFFASGIALAVYLIFGNFSVLEPYAHYIFWVFIGCLILFGVLALIKAILAIKDTISKSKGN